jgi:hypothetical protein
MTDDENEFAQLIAAFTSAQQKFTDASERTQRDPIYEKEESGYHTPTSMGNYRRAKAEHDAATRTMIEAMEETAQAIRALDAWIPEPVHERLNKGILIIAPTVEGWASVGKAEGGRYYVLQAPEKEALEQRIREYAYMNPRSDQVG